MSIGDWNILLNALIGVLLVGYGVWLRKVVHHQLESKDSTIESLGAAIKANEAEIARLRGETAPAIAESYKRVKELADDLAAESNDLAARLKAKDSDQSADSFQRLINYSEGFNAASIIFGKGLAELSRSPHPTGMISLHELVLALIGISRDMNARSNELVKSLQGAHGK
jgi:hypothetical protein